VHEGTGATGPAASDGGFSESDVKPSVERALWRRSLREQALRTAMQKRSAGVPTFSASIHRPNLGDHFGVHS